MNGCLRNFNVAVDGDSSSAEALPSRDKGTISGDDWAVIGSPVVGHTGGMVKNKTSSLLTVCFFLITSVESSLR